MIEITLSPGDPLLFKNEDSRHYRGFRVTGSIFKTCRRKEFDLAVQDYDCDTWAISCRKFEFKKEARFITKENYNWLRMEMVLAGELSIKLPGHKTILLRANQYHITDSPYYQSNFSASSDCDVLVIYVSPAFLQNMMSGKNFVPCKPKPLSKYMRDIKDEILYYRYLPEYASDFYHGRIWDLVFHHLQGEPVDLPANISEREVAAIYAADNKIAEDLNALMTTADLARARSTGF